MGHSLRHPVPADRAANQADDAARIRVYLEAAKRLGVKVRMLDGEPSPESIARIRLLQSIHSALRPKPRPNPKVYEDELPAQSPGGARLRDFTGGRGIYEDGRVFTKSGFGFRFNPTARLKTGQVDDRRWETILRQTPVPRLRPPRP